jgi:hypothetical protein
MLRVIPSLLLVFALWAPVASAKTYPVLVVASDMTLARRPAPYHYGGIQIVAGYTLRLEAGVEVVIEGGGKIEGEGVVSVQGREDAPVHLSGTDWGGITLRSPRLILSWVIIEQARAIEVSTDYLVFDHVVLRDGLLEGIRLSPRTASPATTDIALDRVTIENVLVGSQMARPIIQLDGIFREIWVRDLLVPEARWLRREHVLSTSGTFRGAQLIGGKTKDGCWLEAEIRRRELASLTVPVGCEPKLPVIFVPGFGGSLNLSVLLEPFPGTPTPDGWVIPPVFGDSYARFLAFMARTDIPTSTAYYDWRLPPDRIVTDYLIPAIDAAKRENQATSVVIAAHSYGGIVVRSYIQSDLYRGDVAGFVMMGTPNQGSLKAYGPWEGGSIPPDWSIVRTLLRYYALVAPDTAPSELALLRRVIPALQSLLPTGKVLQREEGSRTALSGALNPTLKNLQKTLPTLIERVPFVRTISGTGQPTEEVLRVGPANLESSIWPDGVPEPTQPVPSLAGDGSVLVSSVVLPGVADQSFAAGHGDLPEVSAEYFLHLYFPLATLRPPPNKASRTTTHIRWFSFDCPIDVQITTPSGLIVNTVAPQPEYVPYIHPNLIVLPLPDEVGTYDVLITAREATPVRWWVNTEQLRSRVLAKGESWGSEVVRQPDPLPAPSVVLPPQFSNDEAVEPLALYVAGSWPPLSFRSYAPPFAPARASFSSLLGERVALVSSTHQASRPGPRALGVLCLGISASGFGLFGRRVRARAHRHPP